MRSHRETSVSMDVAALESLEGEWEGLAAGDRLRDEALTSAHAPLRMRRGLLDRASAVITSRGRGYRSR